jgi:hypothetical protein
MGNLASVMEYLGRALATVVREENVLVHDPIGNGTFGEP